LLRLPGYPVRAEQPVGAGDAFSAGLCAALAHGQPMAQALAMANACGALAASRGGILSTLPCMAEVQTLLDGKTATG
jgi:ribokinase